MSKPPIRRRSIAALVVALLGFAGLSLMSAVPTQASPSSLFTVSKVAPNFLPATTSNVVLTLTGTGFDEGLITSVTVGACTSVGATPSLQYIVGSTTSLVIKITSQSCGAASSGNEPIVITDTNLDTYTVPTTSATLTLQFISPPVLAPTTAGARPVYLDNSSNLSAATRVNKFLSTVPAAGAQKVRVDADINTYHFPTTTGVTASLGGTLVGTVTVATVAQGTDTLAGDYITFNAPAHAAGAVSLSITAANVTKTFTSTQAGGISYWTPPYITSITPGSGKAGGGTTGVLIKGTGFDATLTDYTTSPTAFAYFCGTAATVTAATATQLTVTTPDLTGATTPVVEDVCPVTVVNGSNTSPINDKSYYSFLTQ